MKKNTIFLIFIASTILLFLSSTFKALADKRGTFIGNLVLEVLPDGRNMKLRKPYLYIDSKNFKWPVPENTIVNGASIPKVFWSLIGSPYVGKYRNASVIHDYYCDIKTYPWKAVHRVFYDAMLTSNVNLKKAKLMYLAVVRFGPKWDYEADACFCKSCPRCAKPKIKFIKYYEPQYDEVDYAELENLVLNEKRSLLELEQYAIYQLNTAIFKKH